MGSSLTLKNDIETEFTISHTDGSSAKSIAGKDIAIAVDTINDFPLNPQNGDVVIVRDLDRGGTFIYDSTEIANSNGGTNFNGWIRQYSGAVNVKWFGAKGDGTTDDTEAIQSALNYANGTIKVIIPSGTFRHTKLTIPSGTFLEGDDGVLQIIGGERFGLELANPTINTTISNITFDGTYFVNPQPEIRQELSFITSNVAAGSNGVSKGVIISNNRFINSPPVAGVGSSYQVGHAIQLLCGEATVSGNYTDTIGGDCYNFNNGYFIVTENTAKNVGDGGIAFNNNARGVISNNYLYKCNLGIGGGPGATLADPHHTMIITGNTIVGCGIGIEMGWFAYTGKEGPRNVKITNNTFDKCKYRAIGYFGNNSTTSAPYLVISNNTFTFTGSDLYDGTSIVANSNYAAIVLSNSHNCTITGNIFSGTLLGKDISSGTTNFYLNITNNKSIGGVGIENLATSKFFDGYAAYANISGNTIVGKYIQLIDVDYSILSGNIIDCNITGIGGIHLSVNSTENSIFGNTLRNCNRGISFESVAHWALNNVKNNKFVSCATAVYNSPASNNDNLNEVYSYTGTVDETGSFNIAHGLGTLATYGVLHAYAYFKGNSGEAIPMSITAVDGTYAYFTTSTSYSGRAARGYIVLMKKAISW